MNLHHLKPCVIYSQTDALICVFMKWLITLMLCLWWPYFTITMSSETKSMMFLSFTCSNCLWIFIPTEDVIEISVPDSETHWQILMVGLFYFKILFYYNNSCAYKGLIEIAKKKKKIQDPPEKNWLHVEQGSSWTTSLACFRNHLLLQSL